MNRLKRGAIVLSLVEALREHGSWCGETNIQKAVYFLKEVAGIPFGYGFVLYKYGPYSFELTGDLTALRADAVLEFRVPNSRYGPSYSPGKMAEFVKSRHPKTIASNRAKVEFIAQRLGEKSVTELERLATALYVIRENEAGEADERARRMHELKPHISRKEATTAIKEVEEIIEEAEQFVIA